VFKIHNHKHLIWETKLIYQLRPLLRKIIFLPVLILVVSNPYNKKNVIFFKYTSPIVIFIDLYSK